MPSGETILKVRVMTTDDEPITQFFISERAITDRPIEETTKFAFRVRGLIERRYKVMQSLEEHNK